MSTAAAPDTADGPIGDPASWAPWHGGHGPGRCSRTGLPNHWVQIATGELIVSDRLAHWQGLGPPVTVTLTYRSQPHPDAGQVAASQPGPAAGPGPATTTVSGFGPGWSHGYDRQLRFDADGVTLWQASRPRARFLPPTTPNAEGWWQPASGRDQLRRAGVSWWWRAAGERWWSRFETSPEGTVARLTTVSDDHGNEVTLGYHEAGTLARITDAVGRSAELSSDATGRTHHLDVPHDRRALLRYDQHGRLIEVHDLLGIPIRYRYDDHGTLCELTVGADARTTRIHYEGSGPDRRVVAVTDPLGATTRYETHPSDPTLFRVVDPRGAATTYTVRAGLTERIVDAEGRSRSFRFEQGLPVELRDATGAATACTWDAAGNLTSVSDPLGRTHRFGYDAQGRQIGASGPDGTTWRFERDERGRIVASHSPTGHVLRYRHDERGLLREVTGPEGVVSQLRYDAHGNPTAITDALGHTTTAGYDPAGMQLTSVTDALGHTTRLRYDANDRLVELEHPDGTTIAIGHDACARTRITDERGATTNWERNARLLVTLRTDPLGAVTSYHYDDAGHLVGVVDPHERRRSYGLDVRGRRTAISEPGTPEVRLERDGEGRLVTYHDRSGRWLGVQRDAAGQVVALADHRGTVASIRRDAAGRVVQRTDARGRQVAWQYDAEGRPLALLHDGTQVAAYRYDLGGRMIGYQDGCGTTTLERDALGMLTALHRGDGLRLRWVRDAVNEVCELELPGGLVVHAERDPRGHIVALRWADHHLEVARDPTGAIVALRRSNGTTTRYERDAAGNLTAVTHELGSAGRATWRFERHPTGLLTATHYEGPAELAPLCDPPATLVSTDLDRLASVDGHACRYDAAGNLTAIADGRFEASYDADGRATTVHHDGRVVHHDHDALGHRWQVRTEAGSHRELRDPAGRLHAEVRDDGAVRCVVRLGGLPVALVEPDGETRFLHTGHLGHVEALSDASGELVAGYAYAPFGHQRAHGPAADQPLRFVGGHDVTHEGGGLYRMGSRLYLADLRRFVQPDPDGLAGSRNTYAYANHDPLRFIDPDGRFGRAWSEMRSAANRGFPRSPLGRVWGWVSGARHAENIVDGVDAARRTLELDLEASERAYDTARVDYSSGRITYAEYREAFDARQVNRRALVDQAQTMAEGARSVLGVLGAPSTVTEDNVPGSGNLENAEYLGMTWRERIAAWWRGDGNDPCGADPD